MHDEMDASQASEDNIILCIGHKSCRNKHLAKWKSMIVVKTIKCVENYTISQM